METIYGVAVRQDPLWSVKRPLVEAAAKVPKSKLPGDAAK